MQPREDALDVLKVPAAGGEMGLPTQAADQGLPAHGTNLGKPVGPAAILKHIISRKGLPHVR